MLPRLLASLNMCSNETYFATFVFKPYIFCNVCVCLRYFGWFNIVLKLLCLLTFSLKWRVIHVFVCAIGLHVLTDCKHCEAFKRFYKHLFIHSFIYYVVLSSCIVAAFCTLARPCLFTCVAMISHVVTSRVVNVYCSQIESRD